MHSTHAQDIQDICVFGNSNLLVASDNLVRCRYPFDICVAALHAFLALRHIRQPLPTPLGRYLGLSTQQKKDQASVVRIFVERLPASRRRTPSGPSPSRCRARSSTTCQRLHTPAQEKWNARPPAPVAAARRRGMGGALGPSGGIIIAHLSQAPSSRTGHICNEQSIILREFLSQLRRRSRVEIDQLVLKTPYNAAFLPRVAGVHHPAFHHLAAVPEPAPPAGACTPPSRKSRMRGPPATVAAARRRGMGSALGPSGGIIIPHLSQVFPTHV
ncbi:hypothetical protein DFH07DRAFT_957910 [Mycena maculata]|uniref:Uncharacterized protein n=1 Tax=Mycena maculata TaxID=230809 RepID=A0AAD7NFD6_9AGAR|nr:hypothetical protein DFH07DRAFT_957910 [Mycena maculata]